jgi:hypothetical protein
MAMRAVWRLHLKPSAEGVDAGDFCIRQHVLGVGWAVEPDADNLDWGTYYSRAMEEYYNQGDKGWWPTLHALKETAKIGDLCWTRTSNGKYWLGKIASEWQYRNAAEFKRAHIVNLREAELYEVGNLQEVPGGVLNSLRRGRTLQRIDDEGIALYSMFLFNKLSGKTMFELPATDLDLFGLLSPYECEDIVGIYLQVVEGAIVFPSTCKADTKDFEFVLKRKGIGSYIAVQVKQGEERIHLDAPEYAAFDGDVFVFQTRDLYLGSPGQNVRLLSAADMKRFCLDELDSMPPNIRRWVEVWKTLNSTGPVGDARFTSDV